MRERSNFLLQSAVTKAATYSLTPTDQKLSRFSELIITWKITSAERDSANETYNLYVITENKAGEKWDLVHFPQVAAIGAKTFIARIRADLLPQRVTTAAPGVASNESGTIRTETSAANEGTRTLAAGTVRHGGWGDKIGYDVVIAGTVATGIAYSISVMGVE